YIGMEKCCSTASDWNVGIKARKGQPNRVFIAGSELGALCAFQTGLVVQLYSKNLLERRRAALEHVVLRVGAARVAGAVATRARGDPRGENARPPRRSRRARGGRRLDAPVAREACGKDPAHSPRVRPTRC